MIPTMLLFGLLFGRWWRLALPAAAVVWPAVLLVAGTIEPGADLLPAALLGVANAGAGVGVHQGGLWAFRSLRRRQAAAAQRG